MKSLHIENLHKIDVNAGTYFYFNWLNMMQILSRDDIEESFPFLTHICALSCKHLFSRCTLKLAHNEQLAHREKLAH